jgi:hypothetical protein
LFARSLKTLDNWDHTVQTGNDTEYPLVVLASCAGVAYSLETTDSSGEQAQEAQSVSGTSPPSEQAPENRQQPSTQSVICGVTHLGQCLKDTAHDQAGIWTSPLRIAPKDAYPFIDLRV